MSCAPWHFSYSLFFSNFFFTGVFFLFSVVFFMFFFFSFFLVKIRQVKDEQADAVKKRIRQWESENRVLGHHARSDVHRPRALLSLSGDLKNAHFCRYFSLGNVLPKSMREKA